MGRKAFLADLQAAAGSPLPPGFSSLKQGDEDGTFTLVFLHDDSTIPSITLQATIIVDDYPSAHNAFVYVISDGAPKSIEQALADTSQFDGLTVTQVVSKVAKLIRETTAGSAANPVTLDSEDEFGEDLLSGAEDPEDYDRDDASIADDFDDATFGSVSPTADQYTVSLQASRRSLSASTLAIDDRARHDFRALKQAGFHVSCHGSPFGGNKDFYITISCRIAKLNISEDALNAWGLSPDRYFLLIIHYTNGYRTFDQVHEGSSARHSGYAPVEFRTAVCVNRKAQKQETIDIFSPSDPKRSGRVSDQRLPDKSSANGSTVKLEHFFIDRPLNELLNSRFLDVLRVREGFNFDWAGAERYCQDHQAILSSATKTHASYYTLEQTSWRTSSVLAIGDHFATETLKRSFPLIAIEFTLRHLVHCTDFCLVCHTRLSTNFEALRPYVCSKPLCLYQYMALGFGPSIEHEILSQPYLVDLLVSFCYARAKRGNLKDLPLGMGLDVPDPGFGAVATPLNMVANMNPFAPDNPSLKLSSSQTALYDRYREQLAFDEKAFRDFLRPGVWLAIRVRVNSKQFDLTTEDIVYRRVREVHWPTLVLSKIHDQHAGQHFEINEVARSLLAGQAQQRPLDCVVTPFTSKFDELQIQSQQHVICQLLNSLPNVQDMKNAISSNRSKPLAHLFDDVPSAAFSILRWVIASNRSCIVAIDDPSSAMVNYKERVQGMSGWMQFRFAQGAPDKEQRFMEAVRTVQAETKKKHPTIWAWHGSPLHNWHSIIREGLHFNDIAHGRAFGNGVYHAKDLHTSLGYAGHHHHHVPPVQPTLSSSTPSQWTSSKLRVTSAICLNEIVNAPARFQSNHPYLVVQHVDWIQTRYLFVSCAISNENQTFLQDVAKPSGLYDMLSQDPDVFPVGDKGAKIVLPANAISASRRQKLEENPGKSGIPKKQKVAAVDPLADQDVLMSDVTDVDDLALVTEPELPQNKHAKGGFPRPGVIHGTSAGNTTGTPRSMISTFSSVLGWKRSHHSDSRVPAKMESQTDFVPGSLDVQTLPRLPAPPYATPQANKALAREVKALQKTQSSTSPAELGWHLCVSEGALDNIYQWIVELHTFDPSLPLHVDLKSKGLTSVVLELRFGPQFPFSPPFVRVIRPRFLDFRAGGGGHVTAGGALCMELLTNDGWSAASSIEAVLLQVRMAISSTDPQPARLPAGPVGLYTAGEAMGAYRRACELHGWKIPADFKNIEAQI